MTGTNPLSSFLKESNTNTSKNPSKPHTTSNNTKSIAKVTSTSGTKSQAKFNIQNIASITATGNTSKIGRNIAPGLNPHNTANNGNIVAYKNNVNTTTNKVKNSFGASNTNITTSHATNHASNKLEETLKCEAYKSVASSLENKEGIRALGYGSNIAKGIVSGPNNNKLGKPTLHTNTSLKNTSFSPSKLKIESNRALIDLKSSEDTKNNTFNITKEASVLNVNVAKSNDIALNPNLNEIISTLNKNENKSRNAPRNNLTATKSNLFSSDKAQSMQSGSYQKGHMFTQVNVKSTATIKASATNNPNKAKVSSSTIINKTATSITGYKPNLNSKALNKSKADLNSANVNVNANTGNIAKVLKGNSSKVSLVTKKSAGGNTGASASIGNKNAAVNANNAHNVNSGNVNKKNIVDSGTGGTGNIHGGNASGNVSNNAGNSLGSIIGNSSGNLNNLKNSLFKGKKPQILKFFKFY